MNMKKICLVFIFLLFAFSYAYAEPVPNVGYSAFFQYSEGSLIMMDDASLQVSEYDFDYDQRKAQKWMDYDISDEECTSELDYDGRCCLSSWEKACYRAELYSGEGEFLYEMPFEVGLIINVAPPDGPFEITESETSVGLPYFMEAKTLVITQEGEKLFESDLSKFANCEVLERCKGALVEPGVYDRCPSECPPPKADDQCDAYKDGYFDTDCGFDEDPDCIENMQWCIDQLYGATPTPTPNAIIATYTFSGDNMLIELSKPAEGDLPAGAEEEIVSDVGKMFSLLGLSVEKIEVETSGGELIVSTSVTGIEFPYTFSPVPEYTTIVKEVSEIEPTPDSLENNVATYSIAPESITVSFDSEEGFDWLLALIVGLIVIIGAFMVKRKLR